MEIIDRQDRERLLSPQVAEARYFFLDLVPRPGMSLAVMLGGRERAKPEYVVRRERYAYHVLEIVTGGAGIVELDGRSAELRPGTVYVLGPRTRVQIRTSPERPLVKYFLCLSGRSCAARLTRAGLAPGQVRVVAAVGEVASLVEDVIREGQQHGARVRDICRHLLEILLLKLEELTRPAAEEEDSAWHRFSQCRALINTEAETLMSLRDIAALTALDASSVCRLFRRYQGTSPYQYLLRRKMHLAAEFLMQRRGLVKEAALQVGFTDPYHFSRVFKAVHGLAPRELMRFGGGGST